LGKTLENKATKKLRKWKRWPETKSPQLTNIILGEVKALVRRGARTG